MVKLNNDNNKLYVFYGAQAVEVAAADGPLVEVYGILGIGVADSGDWSVAYGVDGNAIGNVWASQSLSSMYTVNEKKPVHSEIRGTVNSNIIFSSSTSSWDVGDFIETTHTGSLTVKQLSAQATLEAGFSSVAIEKAINGAT